MRDWINIILFRPIVGKKETLLEEFRSIEGYFHDFDCELVFSHGDVAPSNLISNCATGNIIYKTCLLGTDIRNVIIIILSCLILKYIFAFDLGTVTLIDAELGGFDFFVLDLIMFIQIGDETL